MALFDTGKQIDSKYTKKVQIPQYLPSSIKPHIYELFNKEKYISLLTHINTADIPEDEKEFLRFAATRHIVFNYSKIADYYANSDNKVQKLMEESALVIIDFDDAIANGYVKLSKNIKAIMENSGRKVDEK